LPGSVARRAPAVVDRRNPAPELRFSMSLIEPFYFGEDSRLFGIYHPADSLAGGHAVLIAPPLLNESMRAHFALRQIALKLSAAGHHILRFDFSGTGNSLGSPADFRPADWVDDIGLAGQELLEISGATSVSIVTVRFSACLATCSTIVQRYSRCVMWDPVESGPQWLRELRRSQDAAVRRLPRAPLDREREFLGHRVHQDFAGDLTRLKSGDIQADRVLRIVHDDGERMRMRASSDDTTFIPFQCSWESLSSQVLYPHAVIDRICQFLT
jgi:pimeloyl-ACP methyl ester carboxylesterase